MPNINTDIPSKNASDKDLPNANDGAPDAGKTARQRWMALLARSNDETLKAAWEALDDTPDYDVLRPAEVGMVMVRARAAGTGQRFNLGEMTVCRCAVRTAENRVGHAYVSGRNRHHALYAALFDALLQDPLWHPRLEQGLLNDIKTSENCRVRDAARKTATTKVDFFTLVRANEAYGDDTHKDGAHEQDRP